MVGRPVAGPRAVPAGVCAEFEGSYVMKDSGRSNRPRRRSQAQEDAVRKAAGVSAERRSAAAKRRGDVELREAQERAGRSARS